MKINLPFNLLDPNDSKTLPVIWPGRPTDKILPKSKPVIALILDRYGRVMQMFGSFRLDQARQKMFFLATSAPVDDWPTEVPLESVLGWRLADNERMNHTDFFKKHKRLLYLKRMSDYLERTNG